MAGVVWRVSVMRSVCPALSPWLERLNERQRIDPGIPVVKPGVRNVRESHADAHPVAHGARDVQARAELDRTTEVDVASSAIGTDGEPGGEPPLLRDVEIAAEAGVSEDRLDDLAIPNTGMSEKRPPSRGVQDRESSRYSSPTPADDLERPMLVPTPRLNEPA